MVLAETEVEDAEIVEVELGVELLALLVHRVGLGCIVDFLHREARLVVELLRIGWRGRLGRRLFGVLDLD